MTAAVVTGVFTLLGSIVGSVMGAVIGYLVSIRVSDRREFQKAATDFRISFVEEIRFIDRFYTADRASRDIPDVLVAAADKHETALIIFKDGFLCEKQRAEIEKAWKAYTGNDTLMGKHTFKQYATHGNLRDGEKNRKLARDHINELLGFAEITQSRLAQFTRRWKRRKETSTNS